MHRLLTNHLGYDRDRPKQALLQTTELVAVSEFEVRDASTGVPLFHGPVECRGEVENWQQGIFYRLDFTDADLDGEFVLAVSVNQELVTTTVHIGDQCVRNRSLTDVMAYFRNQRCKGEWNKKDHDIRCYGDYSGARFDVHGGWYDASGDKSKYLSHLSYATTMNPQQTPMVVWNLLDVLENNTELSESLRHQLVEEAEYGADFLCRMQHPEGFFFTTVFDNWTGEPEQREICSYKTQAGIRNADYRAGWRMGAGVAIAALARASNLPEISESKRAYFLSVASKGFWHLQSHGQEYLNDRQDNIIDDYCAALAAVELYAREPNAEYSTIATARVDSLLSRMAENTVYEGWFRTDDKDVTPYFHAAEEGLPIIVLLRAIEVGTVCDKQRIAVERALKLQAEFYRIITTQVNNPFDYPRQYHVASDGQKKTAFFYPHTNPTGYWWQGENARIASLSCAFRKLNRHFSAAPFPELEVFATGALNWILGLNPLDQCMLHGRGRNNPGDYDPDHANIHGGICNGFTSGFWDEKGIDFAPTSDPCHAWRWQEQWLLHAAWYMAAICS